ncbi:hypothetical protein [Lactiplantibacillus mudanjiangensis]|uniref:ABC transporter permease [Lactobacillus sp.] n=1 Tax=Lactiplantibacillus mudanjiangensis TaxID=1296538 RepID=A0A660DWI8_9LACO|nr:hypothetical protein [Lactiplantibacillus mudanjiangensis]VDG25271.1 ABC transporter permease [Lactobacillus sp.] [Lactiplantibacillus mudanjiangensis]VDG27476.1 ABC transporter permease [Lactobacillus sp.] [Lactiplantibacillus mudanjiangensis]VDG33053.1 ABC transporter permease [Lactobacillus sp.] [Lactiplantibacillus mudanjiangensis]
MTSFGAVFKAVNRLKFRQMNLLIVLELLAIVVTTIWTAIRGEYSNMTVFTTAMGWSTVPAFVGVILIAIRHEKVYTADSYRLIPVEETKFYTINLLSSLANIVYLAVVQLGIYIISMLFGWQELASMAKDMTTPTHIESGWLLMGLSIIVLVLVLNMVFWSTISFVHLVTSSASTFLPKFRQGVLNIIVYAIVVFLTLRVSGLIGNGVSWISQTMFNNGGSFDWVGQLWITIFVMIVVILIEGAINVLCLKRWVETDAN